MTAARSNSSLAVLLVAWAGLCGGCATYAPLPLGEGQGTASAAQLSVAAADMPLPALAAHRFDPSDGLDVTEVAMLAVVNNPDLRLKRDELGIARAQAFAAGLLPDPQLSVGVDFPTHSGPGLSTAYTLALGADVSALLLRSSRVAAAGDQAGQVNLDLLWAEWQTVAQARLLFDGIVSLRMQQARLDAERAALAPVLKYVRMALDAGNLTYDSASAGLGAGTDVDKRLADGAIQLHQADSDLHVLLGLAPLAKLDLVGDPYQVAPTSAQAGSALATLAQRRPDLIALQMGYRAQEARLRGAILAQFPALTIGFNSARDTSAIYSQGPSIGISLPLFNRNRGNIAIETATRQQLKDAYEARLLAARSDIHRLLADLATLQGKRAALDAHARQLDGALRTAGRAWQGGLLDWPTYLAIRSNALSADLDRIAIHQEQTRQAIALEVLLGRTDPLSARMPEP